MLYFQNYTHTGVFVFQSASPTHMPVIANSLQTAYNYRLYSILGVENEVLHNSSQILDSNTKSSISISKFTKIANCSFPHAVYLGVGWAKVIWGVGVDLSGRVAF